MLYQPWIRGEENIPAEGAAILASNHLAVIDSFFLPLLVDREVAFIGKADYFTGKGVKGWAVKNFMKTVGTIPVDRSGGKASQAALQAGIDRLRSGQLFGIYPEGTRSPDGRLYRGKTGVARIALATGAPVVPVAMIGSNLAHPIGQSLPPTPIMTPAAAVAALAAGQVQQSQDSAVGCIRVVPLANTGTEDNHRTTVRVNSVLRKFARHANNGLRRN